MRISYFVAAGFVALPVFTVLGNGCVVHETLPALDDGGDFGDEDSGNFTFDSGHRDSGLKDASTSNTDSPIGPSGTCAPGSVSSLTPVWKAPTALHQNLCTPAQVTSFVNCLNGLPDATTCTNFKANAANTTCIACAYTPDTASAYGPLVAGTVTIDVNVAGCIARETADLTATGCGAKISANSQCQALACETNCPVPASDDGTAFNALLACEDSSETSACTTYANGAACADALVDGGVASACANGGASFTENATTMVTLFCGD